MNWTDLKTNKQFIYCQFFTAIFIYKNIPVRNNLHRDYPTKRKTAKAVTERLLLAKAS